MEFFNKKEEVLDLQLTEYGRQLLSLGRFKPEFYAFFDHGVLYDNECAGYPQNQNEVERRIQYNTPASKVQPFIVGAETRTKQFLSTVEGALNAAAPGATIAAENSIEFIEAFQLTPQFGPKFFLAQEPLGTSRLTTPSAPAWSVSMLTNQLSASQPQISVNLTASNVTPLDNGVIRAIPQLDITLDYQTFFAPTDVSFEGKKYIPLTPSLNSDGIKLFVDDKHLVVEILEENTDFLKENFDIEVFLVGQRCEGTITSGGTCDPPEALVETLTQLSFLSDTHLGNPVPERDVQFYMNVFVDKEMPPEVAEDLGITDAVLRGQSARKTLSRDIYSDTGPAEPCE